MFWYGDCRELPWIRAVCRCLVTNRISIKTAVAELITANLSAQLIALLICRHHSLYRRYFSLLLKHFFSQIYLCIYHLHMVQPTHNIETIYA